MLENTLVKEINHLNNQEEMNKIEINMYSELIKQKQMINDDEEIAKELYDQLIDKKDEKDRG